MKQVSKPVYAALVATTVQDREEVVIALANNEVTYINNTWKPMLIPAHQSVIRKC